MKSLSDRFTLRLAHEALAEIKSLRKSLKPIIASMNGVGLASLSIESPPVRAWALSQAMEPWHQAIQVWIQIQLARTHNFEDTLDLANAVHATEQHVPDAYPFDSTEIGKLLGMLREPLRQVYMTLATVAPMLDVNPKDFIRAYAMPTELHLADLHGALILIDQRYRDISMPQNKDDSGVPRARKGELPKAGECSCAGMPLARAEPMSLAKCADLLIMSEEALRDGVRSGAYRVLRVSGCKWVFEKHLFGHIAKLK